MEPAVNIALRAARKAGDIIARATERMDLIKIEEKEKNDFVTNVDKAAEQEIIEHTVSYTHLRAHETDSYLVCRLLL